MHIKCGGGEGAVNNLPFNQFVIMSELLLFCVKEITLISTMASLSISKFTQSI